MAVNARLDTNIDPITDESVSRWEVSMKMRGLSQITYGERVRYIRHITRRLGIPATMWQKSDIAEIMHWCDGLRATTRFNYQMILRNWHEWLIEAGYREDDPTQIYGSPQWPKLRPRPARTEHVQEVMAIKLQRKTVMQLLLACYMGLRCFQIAEIHSRNYDAYGPSLVVRRKGHHRGEVELEVHPAIDDYRRAHPDLFQRDGYWFPSLADPAVPVDRKTVSKALSRVCRRAGVPVTAHRLRHWTATELIAAGVPTRVVQEIMQHESIKTTEQYAGVREDTRREALSALPDIGATLACE